MPEENEMKLVEYRLGKIEDTLTSFKDILLRVTRQDDRIASLADKLEAHIRHGASLLDEHERRLRGVEERPMEESSKRWHYIVDYIFKGVVAAGVGTLLVLFGLKGGA